MEILKRKKKKSGKSIPPSLVGTLSSASASDRPRCQSWTRLIRFWNGRVWPVAYLIDCHRPRLVATTNWVAKWKPSMIFLLLVHTCFLCDFSEFSNERKRVEKQVKYWKERKRREYSTSFLSHFDWISHTGAHQLAIFLPICSLMKRSTFDR